jgi:hypothetical protein
MPDICNVLLTIIGVLVTYIGAVYIEWIVFPRRLTGRIDLRTVFADWRFVGLTAATLYIIGVAPFCSTNLIAGTVLVALLLTYVFTGCRGVAIARSAGGP